MMLVRLGNKRKIAAKIASYFPQHKMRIDLFFGAGGAFFSLPKPKYAVLNDFDDDVVNLYLILLERKDELIDEIRRVPASQSLITLWKKNHDSDPMQKAVRFLLLSNFTYLGKGDTLRIGLDNSKKVLLKSIDETFNALQDAKITHLDFREVIGKISFSNKLLTKNEAFVYLDPVYLDTEHYYKVPKWTKDDTADCFELMATCGIKCAMSEFDHPFIVKQIAKYGFKALPIGERQNIKNRKKELLILNYDVNCQMDLF